MSRFKKLLLQVLRFVVFSVCVDLEQEFVAVVYVVCSQELAAAKFCCRNARE